MWPLMLLVGWNGSVLFQYLVQFHHLVLDDWETVQDRHIVYWIAQLTLTGQTVSPLETPWLCGENFIFFYVTRYWFKHRNIVTSVKAYKNDSSFILFGWVTWRLYRALCFLSMTTDGDQSSHLGEARALAPVSQMASNHVIVWTAHPSLWGTPW